MYISKISNKVNLFKIWKCTKLQLNIVSMPENTPFSEKCNSVHPSFRTERPPLLNYSKQGFASTLHLCVIISTSTSVFMEQMVATCETARLKGLQKGQQQGSRHRHIQAQPTSDDTPIIICQSSTYKHFETSFKELSQSSCSLNQIL